jgi:hypothetical protein
MTDSGTVDIHIGPYDYTNVIRANLGYHVMFPLLHDTLQNPMCIGILLSHHHAYLYRCSRYRFCSLFSLTCSDIPVTESPVSGQTMMDVVTLRGP